MVHERPDVLFAAEERVLGVELFGDVARDRDEASDRGSSRMSVRTLSILRHEPS